MTSHTRAAALAALIACAGCGSHEESAPSQPVSLAPAATVPDDSGPCDAHHLDAAIAAAAAAIHRARADVQVSKPDAHFGPRYAHPQMPGQPLVAPSWGWWVSFEVGHAETPENATPKQAPWLDGGAGQAMAPAATTYHPPAHGQRDLAPTPDLEQTAAMEQERMRNGPKGVGAQAQVQTPLAPQMAPPPDPATAPGGPAMSGVVQPPRGMPMNNKPDPAHPQSEHPPAGEPPKIGVFVAVDGTTELL